jgi:peptide/nickel transport system substrate-binding protein
MSVWTGLENGMASADVAPDELAPTSQQQLHWPKFGQHYETSGKAGEAPDIAEVTELLKLAKDWRAASSRDERTRIWHRMLNLHSEQIYVIGVVNGVSQPVVVRNTLRNVPEKGIYNWDPGAFFGIYRPETFWISK